MLYLLCLSVRPCSPFPIDNLSIYSRNFFKFCIHIVIGDEWYGIVNGQNPSIFNRVTALFHIGKMVSGLLLCLPPLGSGDILFFHGRPSVCPSVCHKSCPLCNLKTA